MHSPERNNPEALPENVHYESPVDFAAAVLEEAASDPDLTPTHAALAAVVAALGGEETDTSPGAST